MAIEFDGPSKLHISNRPTKANRIILQYRIIFIIHKRAMTWIFFHIDSLNENMNIP